MIETYYDNKGEQKGIYADKKPYVFSSFSLTLVSFKMFHFTSFYISYFNELIHLLLILIILALIFLLEGRTAYSSHLQY